MSSLTSFADARRGFASDTSMTVLAKDGCRGEVQPWVDMPRSSEAMKTNLSVAIIDDRPLMRDCFGRGLMMVDPSLDLQYYATPDAFRMADPKETNGIGVVLLCIIWSPARAAQQLEEIARLAAAQPGLDVVLLSDIESLDDILKAVEAGARGYIPTSVSLEVAVKAMQLVAAGGVYIPASVVFWSDRLAKELSQTAKQPQQAESFFTSRQMLVIEALRRGKANKNIAYELNMCESTVKVHIRNIMKKLKARNRTEVAYILNDMMTKGKIGPLN